MRVVIDDHVGAGAAERDGGGPANSQAGTGHDGHTSFEFQISHDRKNLENRGGALAW